MEDRLESYSLFKRNKILEALLLAIGFGLFLIFGLRGLQKINSRAVASGEAYRNVLSSDESEKATYPGSVHAFSLQQAVNQQPASYSDSAPGETDKRQLEKKDDKRNDISKKSNENLPHKPDTYDVKAKKTSQ